MQYNWKDISEYRGELYAFSILWIIIFHIEESLFDASPYTSLTRAIINRGNIGVDIFLFISGISLYYSLKKYEKINVINFYKRRFSKLFPIYVFLCIPFFVYFHLILSQNLSKFIKQLIFIDDNHSSFWFLICIAVCYLFYPLLFLLIKNKCSYIVWMILGVYILMFAIFAIKQPDIMIKYNISIGRFPVFILGSLIGPFVYNKKKIHIYFLLIMIVLAFVSDDIFTIFRKYFDISKPLCVYLIRLKLLVQTIGTIFILLPFAKILSFGKYGKILRYIGSITLELYVVHIIVRNVLNEVFRFKHTKIIHYFIYSILLISITFPFAMIFNKIINTISKKEK